MASQTFNSTGTFTAPAGVTSIDVEVWGAGGGGGQLTSAGNSGGGGGGAYSKKTGISVTPSSTYDVIVGAGGSGGSGANAGGDSYFINTSTIMAKGGSGVANDASGGATGGQASASVGDTKFNGGNGGAGTGTGISARGGGGGGAGGDANPGGNGGDAGASNGTGGAGGDAGGGNGGAGATSGANNGQAPGGGGGGIGRGVVITPVNAGNGADGRVIITYTASAPSVETDAATGVGTTTATGNGEITDTGGQNASSRGIVYGTSSQSNPGNTAPGSSSYDNFENQNGDFGTGTFNRPLSGLIPNTTYYFRAYAQNTDGGYTYGDELNFTTDPVVLPTVTTQAPSNIEAETATGNGNITDVGGENCDLRGFVYDTSSHGDPGNVAPGASDYASNNTESGNFGTGAFTRSLTGLTKGLTYYIRSVAHNSAGYSYGSQQEFTTLDIQQEGFRWREDDGNESGASWLDSQDTNITRVRELITRLRALINTTGDLASTQFQLEYKLSTDGVWKKVQLENGKEIVALGSAVEHDTTQGQFNKLVQIDATHFVVLYQGAAGDGFAQTLELNTGTGALTEVGTPLEFDTADQLGIDAVVFDTNKIFVVWAGSGSDGFARVLTVNTSTWGITGGTALEYDTTQGLHPTCTFIRQDGDGNWQFLVCYQGTSADGFAQVIQVATSTYTITEPTSALEFDTSDYSFGSVHKINNDDTRYLLFHQGAGADGFVRILTVNLTTYAVTLTDSLEFDTSNGTHNCAVSLTGTHFLNLWGGGASATGKARVFAVDTTGWTVDPASGTSVFDFDAGAVTWISAILLSDDSINYYVLATYEDSDSDGNMVLFAVNKTTWAVSIVGSLEFTSNPADYNSLVKVSTTRAINAWAGADADGFVQAFDILNEAITLSNSSNITANGANTTAQLTPPSGKTTGDFNAGRIQDDENPADAINIGADDYTELEWSIIATSITEAEEVYQFRVTRNGTVLNTYSVTPQMTIEEPSVEEVDSEINFELFGIRIESDIKNFETRGIDSDNNDRQFETRGSDTENNNRDFEIRGEQILTNDRDFELRGISSEDSDKAFEIKGVNSESSDRGFEIIGNQTENNERNFELTGIAEQDENSDRNFQVRGQDSQSNDRGFELNGIDTQDNDRLFETRGVNSQTDNRDFETRGSNSLDSDREFELVGSKEETDDRSFEIHVIATEDNDRNFELMGEGGAESHRGFELRGIDTDSNDREFELIGSEEETDDKNFEVKGVDTESDDRQFEVKGIDTNTDNRDFETRGIDSEDSDRVFEIRGSNMANNDRNFEVISKAIVNDNRNFELKGELKFGSERNFQIKGYIKPSRSIRINIKNKAYGFNIKKISKTISIKSDKIKIGVKKL